MDFNKMQQA